MMRVLQILPAAGWGGIQTYLASVARYASLCPEISFEFAVATGGLLAHDLQTRGNKVHGLGRFRLRIPWRVWQARRVVRTVLRANRYDAVICHGLTAMAFLGSAVRRAGIPLIFYQHDRASGRHWIERLAREVRPDFAICNSRYTQDSLATVYPGVSSRVIYYPVLASELADARAALRSEFTTPEDAVVIMHASRMVPLKGHAALLEALGSLPKVPGWVAWIVGGPQRAEEHSYYRELRQQAARIGIGERIRFLGHRPDVPRLLRAADIFCQPNQGKADAFGLSFAEALAAGLPVVGTAMGGVLEIVDATCGLLVPPGSAGELTQALSRLIVDRGCRRKMAAAAERRAQLFSPEGHMRELAKLFDRVLGERYSGRLRAGGV